MNNSQLISIGNENGFEALFNYATVGILVISLEGHIEIVNPFVEDLFGYTKEELIGKPVEILIPDTFRSHHKHHHKGYFANPKARQMGSGLELYALKKNGETFPVEISLAHYKLDSKQLAVAFITDISEQKKAMQKIKVNKEKYRNLFKNSVVAMHTTDIKTLKAIEANDVALELFGYATAQDFIDNFNTSAHFVKAEDFEIIRNTLIEKGVVKNRTLQMKKQDGTVFWANIFISLDGEKQIAQTVIVDITEQIRFQEELENKVKERTLELTASLEREKGLNEMKSRFVSMASHEFRTPLTAILSSISLIEAYTKEEQADNRKKHTNRIRSSVNNLVGILNDFLSLEKLEQGVTEVKKEPFDLNAFSKDILEEVNGMLKHGQRIHFTHNGGNHIVQDKKMLRNVFLNLLSNAIKYSEENKEIHFTNDVNGEKVSIKIRDYGIGIPEEEQHKLFTKFYRATNVTNIQGTGLGLSIVRRYVELLGGTIDFNSKSGQGTTFIVEFSQNH
jgi:PAS domain S-box-containing protein